MDVDKFSFIDTRGDDEDDEDRNPGTIRVPEAGQGNAESVLVRVSILTS